MFKVLCHFKKRMSASINFNINVPKSVIKEFFDGMAKVEYERNNIRRPDKKVMFVCQPTSTVDQVNDQDNNKKNYVDNIVKSIDDIIDEDTGRPNGDVISKLFKSILDEEHDSKHSCSEQLKDLAISFCDRLHNEDSATPQRILDTMLPELVNNVIKIIDTDNIDQVDDTTHETNDKPNDEPNGDINI